MSESAFIVCDISSVFISAIWHQKKIILFERYIRKPISQHLRNVIEPYLSFFPTVDELIARPANLIGNLDLQSEVVLEIKSKLS